MPNFENQINPREDFNNVEGDIEDIKKQIASAKSADEIIALASRMKELEGRKSEALESFHVEALAEDSSRNEEKIDQAHGEALEINQQFNENRAAEEEAIRNAEQAEKERIKKEEDAAKIAEIRTAINGTPKEEVSSMKIGEEISQENDEKKLIEEIGAPENEIFIKYGETMRQAADELILVDEKLIENEEALRMSEHGSEEWKKLWSEHESLIKRREDLDNNAAWGNNVIKDPGQKYGESYTEYSNKRYEDLRKYKQTAMNDPYVVLRMIESGNWGISANGNGLEGVSERLRGNPEFIRQALLLSQKHERGSYGSWFWHNVIGEAAKNRNLFIEAVKANHLNYQFGGNEFKSDPEIKKIALESGLSPVFLYKG